jgi:hypothetical protein
MSSCWLLASGFYFYLVFVPFWRFDAALSKIPITVRSLLEPAANSQQLNANSRILAIIIMREKGF